MHNIPQLEVPTTSREQQRGRPLLVVKAGGTDSVYTQSDEKNRKSTVETQYCARLLCFERTTDVRDGFFVTPRKVAIYARPRKFL